MTARQQWTIIGAIVALLGGGLWVASRTLGEELFPVTVGGPAPAFAARAIQTTAAGGTTATPASGPRTLADYRGQVVLLNIWATWCAPCREEIPSLEALYRDFGPRGFKIVAVSVDDANDAPKKIREFLAPYHVTYDVLHDSAGTIEKTYQSTGVPENFVIGADGVVRKKAYAQDWNSTENRALIGRLLDETSTR